MFTKTALVAIFASLVAAQTTLKDGSAPDPITRPLNEVSTLPASAVSNAP